MSRKAITAKLKQRRIVNNMVRARLEQPTTTKPLTRAQKDSMIFQINKDNGINYKP
jgi:hypothetical protein